MAGGGIPSSFKQAAKISKCLRKQAMSVGSGRDCSSLTLVLTGRGSLWSDSGYSGRSAVYLKIVMGNSLLCRWVIVVMITGMMEGTTWVGWLVGRTGRGALGLTCPREVGRRAMENLRVSSSLCDSECAVAGPEDRLLMQGCALYLCLMRRKLQTGGFRNSGRVLGIGVGLGKGL